MAQSKLSRILDASDRVQLPAQERYEFAASKMSYYLMGGFMVLFALFVGYMFLGQAVEGTQNALIAYGIPSLVFVAGLVILLGALPAKVVIDQEGMSIPGTIPFVREKLAWESIEKAELTSVIYSDNWILGLVKQLFASFFAVVELRVVRSDVMSSSDPVEYAILGRVQDKDRALVLRIVREKLGERFTVY